MTKIITTFCLVLLLSPFVGQGDPTLPPDFPILQKLSLEELGTKTEAHKQVWGLGKHQSWNLNQDDGDLIFSFADGIKAVAPAQIIGSYYTKDHTWLWAWDNPSVDETLRVDSLKMRKYGEEHHIDRLTKAKWVGTKDDAWAMAALAVKLCREQGAYLGTSGDTDVFIVFGEVKLSKQ
jgi:hypothetical protein